MNTKKPIEADDRFTVKLFAQTSSNLLQNICGPTNKTKPSQRSLSIFMKKTSPSGPLFSENRTVSVKINKKTRKKNKQGGFGRGREPI